MTPADWLLDSDPALRWQAMTALADSSDAEIASERAKMAKTGWTATLLDNQDDDGVWRTPGYEIESGAWTGSSAWTTMHVLQVLRDFGVDAADARVSSAVSRLANSTNFPTSMPSFMPWAGRGFFEGETEPCINGRVVASGAYFGQDVQSVVDRLLGEQMADGGWNCEAENGSVRGSFGTSINVLEGLMELDRVGRGTPATQAARKRGEEYLLERGLMRRLSTGDEIEPKFSLFKFPYAWRYDILRGLDYFRAGGSARDPRMDEALALVASKRGEDGKWRLQDPHAEEWVIDMSEEENEPSRWITLHAKRVLRYFKAE